MKAASSVAILLTLPLLGSAQGPKGKRPDTNVAWSSYFEKSKNARYSGVRLVTVYRAGKVETYEEIITRDGARSRVEFSNNSPFVGQIIVENGSVRKHYFPDKNEIRESPGGRRGMNDFRVRPNLTIVKSDGPIIAGFKTVAFSAADPQGNKVMNIYFEPKSGIALKRVMYDRSGATSGSFEFKSLTMNPKVNDNAFIFNRAGAKIVRPIDLLNSLSQSRGTLALRLPEKSGYLLESVMERHMMGRDVIVSVYSGRRGRVTLFSSKGSLQPPSDQRGGQRRFNSYAWNQSGTNFVILGEESLDVLKSLAASAKKG
jgi:outer membrane lipoprotein-sorting protein